MSGSSCEVCAHNDSIERGDDAHAIARLQTGYVKLNPMQYFRGYTTFTATRCVPELHHLSNGERDRFLHEMAEVAHALWRACTARKLNYELLGNGAAHLRWHLFPRYDTDAFPGWPVWSDPKLHELWAEGARLDPDDRDALRARILTELRASDVVIEQEYC